HSSSLRFRAQTLVCLMQCANLTVDESKLFSSIQYSAQVGRASLSLNTDEFVRGRAAPIRIRNPKASPSNGSAPSTNTSMRREKRLAFCDSATRPDDRR